MDGGNGPVDEEGEPDYPDEEPVESNEFVEPWKDDG
jgi:hypothetical protein